MFGWVAIGVLAPLGLRSPIFKTRKILNLEVSPGITYGYDIVRKWLTDTLDDRMSSIRRKHRERLVGMAKHQGWTLAPALARLEQHVNDLHAKTDLEQKRILEGAYLAADVGAPTVDPLAVIINVLIESKLKACLDDMCHKAPNEGDILGGQQALMRARNYVEKSSVAISAKSAAARAADIRRGRSTQATNLEEGDAGPATFLG